MPDPEGPSSVIDLATSHPQVDAFQDLHVPEGLVHGPGFDHREGQVTGRCCCGFHHATSRFCSFHNRRSDIPEDRLLLPLLKYCSR